MIRKLFFIISMVSALALFSSCSHTSLKYIWIHEDGSPYSAMEGRLTLKDDAWDDGRVEENEVRYWALQATNSQAQGFHDASFINPFSSLHYFDLFTNPVFQGGYEVHFPRVGDPNPDPSHDYPHWIQMEYKLIDYNFDQYRLWFDYTYGITNPSIQPTWQGSGYFLRLLTYRWVSDDCSRSDYNFDATLTVKGDAWEDGVLIESEVVSWSFTSIVQTSWNDGWYIANDITAVELRTNGTGGYEVHFSPSTTPDMEHILHWVVMDQHDGTEFNVDEIPMTAFYWLDPDAHGVAATYNNCTGRFVRSGRGRNPPPFHQLPIITPVIK